MQQLPPLANGKRGAIAFTSSPAFLMPCPFSSMYGSTKAFLTEFATSLAPEIRCDGIDVTVPCLRWPRILSCLPLDAIEFFKSTATGPERIVDVLLDSVESVLYVIKDTIDFVEVLLKLVMNFISSLR